MFHLLLCLVLLTGCASGPVEKENAYKGEALSEIGPFGLVVGYAVLPVDKFPYDLRRTVVHLENTKTKKVYPYDTKGSFYLKLPQGEYRVTEISSGEGCHSSTGIMISSFLSGLPENVYHLRNRIEKPATEELRFQVGPAQMTDVGSLLLTCLDWDVREKYKQDFSRFIEDGKFQMFKVSNSSQNDCGCKILQRRDGRAVSEMKRELKKL